MSVKKYRPNQVSVGMFDAHLDGWLKDYVNNTIANQPPIYKHNQRKMRFIKEAGRINKEIYYLNREPTFFADVDHLDDVTWIYEEVE